MESLIKIIEQQQNENEEQEKCVLVRSGAVALLLDAYASLNGYRKAYFLQAFPYAEGNK